VARTRRAVSLSGGDAFQGGAFAWVLLGGAHDLTESLREAYREFAEKEGTGPVELMEAYGPEVPGENWGAVNQRLWEDKVSTDRPNGRLGRQFRFERAAIGRCPRRR
jgi:hypothetical protein